MSAKLHAVLSEEEVQDIEVALWCLMKNLEVPARRGNAHYQGELARITKLHDEWKSRKDDRFPEGHDDSLRRITLWRS